MSFTYKPKELFLDKSEFTKKYLIDVGYLWRFTFILLSYAIVAPAIGWFIDRDNFIHALEVMAFPLAFIVFAFIFSQIYLFTISLNDWNRELQIFEDHISIQNEINSNYNFSELVTWKKRGTCFVLKFRSNSKYRYLHLVYPDRIPNEIIERLSSIRKFNN